MAKTTKTAPVAVETMKGEPTAAMIRAGWETFRAERIIRIMRDDGISYDRAVKRSRRRMHNDGSWR